MNREWERSGELEQRMRENGFSVIYAKPEEISAYYKQNSADSLLVVLFLDYHRGFFLSREGFDSMKKSLIHLLESSKGQLPGVTGEEKEIRMFTVVCAEETEAAKQMLFQEKNFWLIDRTTGHLLIYEDQPADFFGLRSILEDLLEEEISSDYDLYPERDSIQKRDSVRERNKTLPVITLFLIAVNGIVFLVTELLGDTTNAEYMVHCGAMFPPLIQKGGVQNLRFVSSLFLHFGFLHLFNNMLALYLFGEMLEKLIGKMKFLMVYFLGGILGNVVSYGFGGDDVVSAGASGAVYALIGAIVVWVIYAKLGNPVYEDWTEGEFEEKNRKRLLKIGIPQLIFMLIMVLYYGSFAEGIDSAAHLGGFGMGVILTLLDIWIM